MKTVSIVVLIGRSKENFIRCAKSIQDQTRLPEEVVFVYDKLYCNFNYQSVFQDDKSLNVKNIIFDRTDVNISPQPLMRNEAIKQCAGDYIWFVDDDVELDRESCDKLYRLIGNIEEKTSKIASIAGYIDDVGYAVPKMKIPIYLSCFRGACGYYSWKPDDFPHDTFKWVTLEDGEQYPVVPFVRGASMIFCRSILTKAGGFDPELCAGYASYEDSQPSFTLSRLGYKTIYASEVKLKHFREKRLGGLSRLDNNLRYASSMARNYAYVLRKNEYPTKIRAKLYPAVFAMTHSLRVYKNFVAESHSYNLLYLFKSIHAVVGGYMVGVKVSKEGGPL